MPGKFTTLYLLLAFCSCQPQTAPAIPGDYFPLEPGSYSEFRVESEEFAAGSGKTITRSKIRRSIQKQIHTDGQPVFPILYSSERAPGEWKTDSVSSAWATVNKAVEQEGGKAVIKMALPLSERLKWKCNSYNINDPSESIALQVNQPQHIGGRLYPQTVTIVRQDDSTLLSRKKYIEVYAANVGLVMRERLSVRYCHSGDCIGKGMIESGWKEVFILEKTGKQ